MSTLLSDIKKLGKQSVVYGLSTALGRAVSLITAPILTRIFAPSDYGIIALVQVAIGFAIIFAGMNLGSGITYYYFHYSDEKTQKSVLASGITVVVILGLFISSLLYVFAPRIDALFQLRANAAEVFDLAPYLRIASLGLFFGLVQTAMQTILRINQKPQKYFFVEVGALLTYLFSVLFLVVWLRVGLEGVFWSGVASSFVGMLLGIFFVHSKIKGTVSLALLGPIVLYALPQLPGVVVNWVQSQIGRLFINYHATLTEQGLYSIAFILASVLVMIATAFRMAYDPYAMSIMKNSDAKSTYAKFYSLYAFVFGALFGLIAGFAKPALIILTPPEYYAAHSMVFWLAGGAFFMGANNILGTGIWITRKTVFTSYAQFITFAVVVVASLLLVPRFEGTGAAIAFFLGSVAQSLAYYFFAQRLYRISYRYMQVNLMMLCLMILGWLHSRIVDEAGLVESIMIGMVTFIFSVVFAFVLAFSEQHRQRIRGLVAGKLLNS